jgi:hypothetical protein
MSLYKLITSQLSQAGFHYEEKQLRRLDIIEYMVLESAGALHPLQGKLLKCVFRPGHQSNILFQDNKKRSSLEFGLKDVAFNLGRPSISEEEEINFLQIVNAIERKFPESSFDYEHRYYNIFETLYAVILLDEDIENAIKSSSLFVAAGALSDFDLESLLLLRKKLSLYKIADYNLSALVDRLADKVSAYLSEHFDQYRVQQTLPQVERKFAAMLAISREEQRFNKLFHKLNSKLHELTEKGKRSYETFLRGRTFLNKKYDPNYSSVALIAQLLSSALVEARNNFFNNNNNPISQRSFEHFKRTCLDAIENSKDEFAKFRGWAKWYNELNSVLKALITCLKVIGGIIAGITVVPAGLIEIYSEQGYIGTFFNNKTESLRKLETFEQKLCAEGGIFDKLNEEISSIGMAI